MEWIEMRKSFWSAVLLACLCALSGGSGALAQDAAPEPLSAFPQSLLAIRTTAGTVVNFKIWTADSPRREEQGLMFVRELDEHAGMLFVFSGNRQPAMWMKNTYIPLDLLFIDEHGRIQFIAAQATPLSLSIIQSPAPARAVLELKGGACDRLGVRIGDTVMHSALHTAR
jgi:uncharacterized protein